MGVAVGHLPPSERWNRPTFMFWRPLNPLKTQRSFLCETQRGGGPLLQTLFWKVFYRALHITK